jgi:hypothetical protein
MKNTLLKKLVAGVMTFVFAFALVVPAITFAQIPTEFGGTDASFDGTLQGAKQNDLAGLITEIMNWLFGFLGILAVLVILYGGFKWMTAGGDDDKVGEAKKLIINGIIGLIIILSAYAIATFVFTEVQTSLLGSGTTTTGN